MSDGADFFFHIPLRALIEQKPLLPHLPVHYRLRANYMLQVTPSTLNSPDPREGIQQISSCISSVIQHLVKGEHVVI